MPDSITLLTSVLSSLSGSAALVFLTKSWISERLKASIKSEYDEKLETHKAQLQAQNHTQLEHFKAQLQIAANERSIRLTRVFDDVVDTVKETYAKLLGVQDAVGDYTKVMGWQGEPAHAERRKVAGEKFGDFLKYYRPKKPLLPAKTVAKIDGLVAKMHQLSWNFLWNVEKASDSRVEVEDQLKTWQSAQKFMVEDVPGILSELEDDLRRILGTYEGKAIAESVQSGFVPPRGE